MWLLIGKVSKKLREIIGKFMLLFFHQNPGPHLLHDLLLLRVLCPPQHVPGHHQRHLQRHQGGGRYTDKKGNKIFLIQGARKVYAAAAEK